MSARLDQEAVRLFFRYREGINFMTPHVVRFGWAGDLAYELSRGDGLVSGTTIYGVTVVAENGRRDDLSKLCETLVEAEAYIATLAELNPEPEPTEQERAEAMYPNHHPVTALANYRAGHEVWDTNGDAW